MQPATEATGDALLRALADSITRDPWPLPPADPPQREAVAQLLGRLRTLLFPRAVSSIPRDRAALDRFVTEHAAPVRAGLLREITAAFATISATEIQAKANGAIESFFTQLPGIRAMLAIDAQAAYDGDPAARSVDEVILCYPGFFAVLVHRVSHALHEIGVPLVPRMMSEHVHTVTGIDIHPGAKIGQGFFIDHGTGTTIGETAEIGDFCKIYQGITLGAKSFERDEFGRMKKGYKRHPTLMDHVTIYAGATVLGGDTVIGAGCVIAGNVFVTQSVAPNTLVAHQRSELRLIPRNVAT